MILLEDKITKTKNDMKDFMIIGGYDHDMNEDINHKWQQFKRNLVLEFPKHKFYSIKNTNIRHLYL